MMGKDEGNDSDNNDEFEKMKNRNLEHQMSLNCQQSCQHKHEPIYSKDGKWCYQISIIDYLQTFDLGKK